MLLTPGGERFESIKSGGGDVQEIQRSVSFNRPSAKNLIDDREESENFNISSTRSPMSEGQIAKILIDIFNANDQMTRERMQSGL